jgi:MFS family permease
VSALMLALLVREPARRAAGRGDGEGLWAGVRCLARDRVLRPLTVAYAGIELAIQALFLSLPILAFTAHDRDAALAGLLLAAWGAGALVGSLPALRLATRDSIALIRIALLAEAAPLWLIAAPAPPLVLGLGMTLSGLANPIANAPANTLVTLSGPERLRAKTMLAFITASTAAGGVGLFLAGPLAEAFGPREVIAGAAALCTACAVGFGFATRKVARRSAGAPHEAPPVI